MPPHPFDIPSYPPREGDVLSGVGCSYKIVGPAGDGGKGLAYLAERVMPPSNESVVLKVPNIDPHKLTTIGQEKLFSEVNHAIDAEVTAMNRLLEAKVTGIAKLLEKPHPYPCKIEGYFLNSFFLVYEHIAGDDLDKWCKKNYGSPFFGLPSQIEWFRLARELTTLLRGIHNEGVVHGDIWPSNIRIRAGNNEPVLLDFGQSDLLDRVCELTQTVRNWHRHIAPERIPEVTPRGEMIRNARWYAPADIYSLGGILFYLATGERPPHPWQKSDEDIAKLEVEGGGIPAERLFGESLIDNDGLKERIRSEIEDRNPKLYQSNPGIVDIILYCMRPSTEDRASYAGAVLNAFDIFDPQMRGTATLTLTGVKNRIGNLTEVIGRTKETINPFFCLLCDTALKSVQEEIIESLHRQVHFLSGDRETIVNGLLRCFSSLSPEDQCLALTTPWFWKERNCGPNGRLLTALRMAARNGVRIRWLLVGTDKIFRDEAVRRILDAQKNAMKEFESEGTPPKDYNSLKTNLEVPGYYVGVVNVDQPEYKEIVAQKREIFILLRKGGKYTRLSPEYTMSQSDIKGSLCGVRFLDEPGNVRTLLNRLEKHLPHSTPVTQLRD